MLLSYEQKKKANYDCTLRARDRNNDHVYIFIVKKLITLLCITYTQESFNISSIIPTCLRNNNVKFDDCAKKLKINRLEIFELCVRKKSESEAVKRAVRIMNHE